MKLQMKLAKVRSPAFILQNPVIRAVLYPQQTFTVIFFEELNIDPKNPEKPDRDRFVLSKGHAAPGYYAALAKPWIFPGGRFKDTASHWFLSSGSSG